MPPELRKRANLTFRVTSGMRDQLANAAAAEGRSISEEIEHRLWRSFLDHNAEMLGYGSAGALVMVARRLASDASVVELAFGRPIFGPNGIPWAFREFRTAFERAFDEMQPHGEPDRPPAELDNRPFDYSSPIFRMIAGQLHRRLMAHAADAIGEKDRTALRRAVAKKGERR
jgi:hypothetical protein